MHLVKNSVRKVWYYFFKRGPVNILASVLPDIFVLYAGFLLLRVLPKKYVRNIERLHFSRPHPILGPAIDANYYRLSREDQEKRVLAKWGSDAGNSFHVNKGDDPQQMILKRKGLTEAISDYLTNSSMDHDAVIEIGTGSGHYLNHLSKAFSAHIESFVGLDLNASVVKENSLKFRASNISFATQSLDDFVETKSPLKAPIFVSCGVLECFNMEQLSEALNALSEKYERYTIGIVEPTNLDLENEVISRPRSRMYYSHNYPYLFEKAGLKVIWDQRLGGVSHEVLAIYEGGYGVPSRAQAVNAGVKTDHRGGAKLDHLG